MALAESDRKGIGRNNATVILLVEDDVAIAETVIYALQREHFSVHHCHSAQSALNQMQQLMPDLAILDVGLPDANGFDLCKLLQQHYATPFIFLTAHSEEIDRVLGLELGAEDYISKPFSPRELVLRVKAVLRRHGNTQVIRAGLTLLAPDTMCETQVSASAAKTSAFVIDHACARISWHGQLLTLTRAEYKVLGAMAQQAHRIFSRDQLLDYIGPSSEDSHDRAVDTLIKQLRAKLRAIRTDVEPIVTHRGMGYSVDPDV